MRFAVDPHAHVAATAKRFPQRFVLLADRHFDRRHDVELRARRLFEQLVDDLIGRLRADGDVAVGAVRLAQPGEQDAEIIVDFGHRADGRARRVAGVALFDGNGRRQAVDVIDLRLLHLADELPGVRAETFDVAPLSLGIDRVHRERVFPAPLGPQNTVIWSRGILTSRSRRLCCAAPRTVMCVASRVGLPFAVCRLRRLRRLLALSSQAIARAAAQVPGPCATLAVACDFLRRAAGDDAAARVAAFGTDVDDPIGRFDDVQIVFHHQHGVARVDKLVQHFRSSSMSAKCRPVVGSSSRYIVRPVDFLHQFAGQLDALCLAAGERRRRLSDLDVVEPHRVQRAAACDESAGCSRNGRALPARPFRARAAMFFSLYITWSVSRLKRWPPHTGQVTQTSARKSISSRFEPLPSQASQRPPCTLKLNRPGL